MLALLAVLFHLFMPVLHGAAVAAGGGEGYVQICTGAGIKLVPAAAAGQSGEEGRDGPVSSLEGHFSCSLCPVCAGAAVPVTAEMGQQSPAPGLPVVFSDDPAIARSVRLPRQIRAPPAAA